jgi:hypothetical protein
MFLSVIAIPRRELIQRTYGVDDSQLLKKQVDRLLGDNERSPSLSSSSNQFLQHYPSSYPVRKLRRRVSLAPNASARTPRPSTRRLSRP